MQTTHVDAIDGRITLTLAAAGDQHELYTSWPAGLMSLPRTSFPPPSHTTVPWRNRPSPSRIWRHQPDHPRGRCSCALRHFRWRSEPILVASQLYKRAHISWPSGHYSQLLPWFFKQAWHYYLHHGGYALCIASVCMSVCLSVNKIAWKVVSKWEAEKEETQDKNKRRKEGTIRCLLDFGSD